MTNLAIGTDILSLELAGVRIIILDTYQAAVDVLVKSGNDALQRSPLSLVSMTIYELTSLHFSPQVSLTELHGLCVVVLIRVLILTRFYSSSASSTVSYYILSSHTRGTSCAGFPICQEFRCVNTQTGKYSLVA